jgi:8-oxo-dGTP pyrophosphatase MutT (NUDIX family)
MNRQTLLEEIARYLMAFPAEVHFVTRFQQLLTQPECFQRYHLPGHITGSAWIINGNQSKVLLVHHAKLNRWLQPGGHADGEEDVTNVALREAQEETGVKNFHLLSPAIFDIDIHPIPARPDFPAHDHYDVRFLFQADDREPLIVSEESHDVRWIELARLADFNAAHSIQRLHQKLATLR